MASWLSCSRGGPSGVMLGDVSPVEPTPVRRTEKPCAHAFPGPPSAPLSLDRDLFGGERRVNKGGLD
jgi:hypothetical protein